MWPQWMLAPTADSGRAARSRGGRFRARVAIELKGERLREMWIRSLDGLPVVAELSNRYVDRLSRLSSAPDGK